MSGPTQGAPRDWRSLVGAVTPDEAPPLALGVALRRREPYRPDDWSPRRTEPVDARTLARLDGDFSLGVRPLARSARSDAWVKTGASWDALRRPAPPFRAAHVHWFRELAAMLLGTRPGSGWGDPGEWLTLDDLVPTLFWAHLREGADLGVPVVAASAAQTVALGREAAAELFVVPDGESLALEARVVLDHEPLTHHLVRPLGRLGVYAAALDRDPVPVVLAPAELADPVQALLADGGRMRVAPDERAAFLAEGLPVLQRRVRVRAAGGIVLPPPPEPVAVVTTTFRGDEVSYRLEWSYAGARRRGFDDPPRADDDPQAEGVTRRSMGRIWVTHTDAPFAGDGVLRDVQAAEFAAKVLPAWADLPGVRVEGDSPPRAYTELTGDPRIRITAVASPRPDWFDLGIVVSVEGRPVPFGTLIAALVRGRRKLLLADGAYFSLAHPALQRLRDLLAEAGELAEWETDTPRLSRHQAPLWEEFEDLADEADAAVEWRELVQGLRDQDHVPRTPVPTGFRGSLRDYQRAGFDRLAFLWRHRLGGVLADDMGLGKTVQLLALIAHIGEQGPGAPVLVVAPTSVVPAWAEQAARFVPGLRVHVVAGTAQATGTPAVPDGVDVVLTSYALLRLDAAEYTRGRYRAVVLDEAQFVKNPRTRLHRTAAELHADAVFAATGTPLENSLQDLWALFALTAPGLFPSARRFRDEYVVPIEHGKVPEHAEAGSFRAARLARLRRRIRPLMLRRTKELVAAELPPRQELELRVSLDPEHRALYDTVLQRERQKVLGLLDDLDRNRFIVFRSLTLLRLMSLSPALVDDAHRGIPAAKLDALLDRLAEVAAEGHRALVFSQFTSFLRLAAARLDAAGIAHEYLDGATVRRGEVVERFRSGDAPAFLISLKAGGFGLTLTEADYVFVLDPWWNPAAEAQAVDRAHRIGQTASVMVYRLIAADTIEEKVVALQRRKARLFQAVVDDDALFAQGLSADDIRSLLG
ncbi:DEAD/DEAH box helicase [Microbacterium sp. GXF7504]